MRTQKIEYLDEEQLLEAYLAFNPDITKPRPAILIAHDWSGRNDFAMQKAEKLAELGFVGFAVDMFGKDVIGQDKEEKMELIRPFLEDRSKMLRRMESSLKELQKIDVVDVNRIGAIGFCFGGMCVLDLARSGAELAGVVSCHGLLQPPSQKTQKIHAKVLALHGHDDPMVPPHDVLAFQDEMTHAEADWQMHIYGNTMHAFTNPQANDHDFGTVYNEMAEKRAWLAMHNFFAEVFA